MIETPQGTFLLSRHEAEEILKTVEDAGAMCDLARMKLQVDDETIADLEHELEVVEELNDLFDQGIDMLTRDLTQAEEQLTVVQTRCTELVEEKREQAEIIKRQRESLEKAHADANQNFIVAMEFKETVARLRKDLTEADKGHVGAWYNQAYVNRLCKQYTDQIDAAKEALGG